MNHGNCQRLSDCGESGKTLFTFLKFFTEAPSVGRSVVCPVPPKKQVLGFDKLQETDQPPVIVGFASLLHSML